MEPQNKLIFPPVCSENGQCRPEPIPRPEPKPPADIETNPLPPSSGSMPEEGKLPDDSIDPALLSLAMAFVPRQSWEGPYAYDVAHKRGTIFPSLDKPFLGEEAISK